MKWNCKDYYKGKIKNFSHILISDPCYNEDAWCRYERKDLNKKDWVVNIQLSNLSESLMGVEVRGIQFRMVLQPNKKNCLMVKDGIRTFDNVSTSTTRIGMDSACVAFGMDEYADEIIKSQDEWQPDCSLKTLTDGIFGEVIEGTVDNQIAFICFEGFLDEDTDYSKEEVLKYICTQFKIDDLQKLKDDVYERYNF